ncbi:hypothetical protein PRUPE_4G096800 [Prunus persica]|uniref:Uncharacterized protein n=1 Tax=Prunus persica TaxID=3760 RepID=A0A251PI63_PRUPE|nr:hypothetical protein PRUPE_4G096800 [Prunus persica]
MKKTQPLKWLDLPSTSCVAKEEFISTFIVMLSSISLCVKKHFCFSLSEQWCSRHAPPNGETCCPPFYLPSLLYITKEFGPTAACMKKPCKLS